MSAKDAILQAIDAINRHDPDALGRIYSEDAVVYDPMYPEPLRGRDAVRTDMEDFLRAFPDLRVNLRSAIDHGETVAYEIVMTGTHQGPIPTPDGGEIPATNKRVEMNVAGFSQLDGQGRIAQERRYYDLAGLLAQLGITG